MGSEAVSIAPRAAQRYASAQLRGGGFTRATVLKGVTTWNPAGLSAGQVTFTTVTVHGAVAGNPAIASHTQLGANNVLLSAHVQAADTVRVVLKNETGGLLDVANGTLTVLVFQTG